MKWQNRPASSTSAPQQSSRCEHCQFGIVRMPAAQNYPAPLYLMRALMFRRGRIEFCNCRSGALRRQHCEQTLQNIDDGSDYLSPSILTMLNEWIDENPLLPSETGA